MTVEKYRNGWAVIEEGILIRGGFETCAAAWRWIDRYEGEPISKAEDRTDWFVTQILRGGE